MKNPSELTIRIALYCALLSPSYTFASIVAASQEATVQTSFNSELLAAFPNQAQLTVPQIVEFRPENNANDVLTYLTAKPNLDVKTVALVVVFGDSIPST